ncbi:flagellin [Thauera sp. WH-1]|uniref:flagellin n=1 Tax=Thauera sp. WH-1 TaxID=3398230 RepID=UPI0039FC2046
MAQTINTNVASLNAQRNLTTSQSSLSTSIQRLSSGLRINSAKDDAAGLAISERFSGQIRGINQAVRNANDGISLAQTAEGAMVEVGNNLQRIRELAVQSSNATNSTSDRQALQKEVNQLVAEIDRVAKNTEFNGTKLLDGNFSGQAFQVGANAGQLITIDSITNAQADSLGGAQFASAAIAAATVSIENTDAGDTKVGYDAITVADFTIGDTTFEGFTIEAVADNTLDATTAELTAQNAVGNKLVSTINAKSAEAGVVAALNEETGIVTITSLVAGEDGDFTTDLTGATVTNSAAAAASFVGGVDISNFAGSQQAIAVMDKALEAINSGRADLGAIQNRFTSTIANLQTTSENLSASRGRIVDADFATETANLTRAQILQQAGTAMLAQANGLPQNVLSLLRG